MSGEQRGASIASDAAIAACAAVALAMWLVVSRLQAGGNVEFDPYDLTGVAWYVLAALLVAWIAARCSRPRVAYREPLLLVAAFAPAAIATCWLLGAVESRTLYGGGLALLAGAGAAFMAWGLRRASGRRQLAAVAASVIAAGAIGWASDTLGVSPAFWYAAEGPGTAAAGSAADESDERLLFEQPERVDRAVAQIGAREPGRPNAFFVGFAGDGDQKVFAREIELAERVVGGKYGSAGRSVRLVNDKGDLDRYPLATVSGLRRALQEIGQRMDREQDVLFLVLSSHGSEGAEIATTNGELPLRQLTGAELAAALADARILWRVIVISACYSGAFIPSLQEEHTIVLTASAPDRTSFGCSDDRDLTYFGEAFFRDALPRAATLREAFDKARGSILEREMKEDITPSFPQAFFGAQAEQQVEKLRSG